MPHFRKIKEELRKHLKKHDFNIDSLPAFFQNTEIEQWVSPLFACLPLEDSISQRAAKMLGYAVSQIALKEMEKARIIIRRMIWQMNEESGNIGWGIPLAFAQSLAQSKNLAKEYYKIPITYIWDIDADSNYCDHAPLRIYCYQAVELLLDAYPEYQEYARKAVLSGKNDPDPICKQKAVSLIEKYGYQIV